MSALVIVSALVVGLLIHNALSEGDNPLWAWCGGLVLRLWRCVRLLWFAYFAFQTAVCAYGLLVWVYTGGAGFAPPVGHQGREPAFFSGLGALFLVTGFYAAVAGVLWWSLWGHRGPFSTEDDRRGAADAGHREGER
jgi:hypothetical protein